MEIGMLWFDDDAKRTLQEKVSRAVEHYRTKYGAAPNVCFVNPAMIPGGPALAGGVQMRPAKSVMPNHFWLGVGEATGAGMTVPRGRKAARAAGHG